ncbi:hypothetical protein [uncultured Roseobacter sp.]|uniref:hypothetical protein n=1 Tax=uncultured Roseobacter sp. TaxID=114847 RepID=UPI0026190746|nr:hypothetical protein [uncultured Roseobacter sp.]
MLKLLNVLSGQDPYASGPKERYSRFETDHKRQRVVRAVPPGPPKPAPEAARQPVAAPAPAPVTDLVAQLHCESSISTSVLRSALPNRFAQAG